MEITENSSCGTWVAWLFIFLIILGFGVVLLAKHEHKESRDRQFETLKSVFDSEKQTLEDQKEGLKNFASMQRENDKNTAAIVNAITTGFTHQNAKQAEAVIAAQAQEINKLSIQDTITAALAPVKAELSRTSKSPNVYANSYLCPDNSCGC